MTETQPRVALITGGSRGIGLGIARALAQTGWSLAINGVRAEAGVEEVLGELRGYGGEVVYCRGDVGQSDQRIAIFDQIRDHFGRFHVLVNNAGITSPGRLDLLEATEAAFDQVMAVNFEGAFHLTQLAARWMIEQRQRDTEFAGTIINISSVSAQFASSNRGDYCLSWACLSETTEQWAARLAEEGIGVFEIRPGIIRTDMTRGVTAKYDKLIDAGLTAQRRWGTPEDVGRAVAMLARGELTYATGNTISIDGGLHFKQRF